MAQATFAAGCFWGVEAVFKALEGVVSVEVGYTGGNTENPSYELVCTGQTGHAEAVHIEFDPETISFEDLLETFWSSHDPTTLDRQGPDVGSQYRSAIFYNDERQKAAAEKSIAVLDAAGRFDSPIVTEVQTAGKFWPAEDYHQDYFAKNPGAAFCHT
jgi:peptide-methionine (S)-S-oxide reductase